MELCNIVPSESNIISVIFTFTILMPEKVIERVKPEVLVLLTLDMNMYISLEKQTKTTLHYIQVKNK